MCTRDSGSGRVQGLLPPKLPAAAPPLECCWYLKEMLKFKWKTRAPGGTLVPRGLRTRTPAGPALTLSSLDGGCGSESPFTCRRTASVC